MELNFGDWEGRFWAAIDGPEAREWGNDFIHRRPPGGEAFTSLARRVHHALGDAHGTAQSILWLSHGGPIRAALAELTNQPLAAAFDWPIPFAEPRLGIPDASAWFE